MATPSNKFRLLFLALLFSYVSAYNITSKPLGYFSPKIQTYPYLGLDELLIPESSDGRKHSRHYEKVDANNKHIKLHYDIELAENTHFITLDTEPGVTHVSCQRTIFHRNHSSDGFIIVRFNTSSQAQRVFKDVKNHGHENVRLTASRMWECPRADGSYQALWLRVVGDSPTIIDTEIKFQTLKAGPHHLFKHADVHARISKFPENHMKEHSFSKEDVGNDIGCTMMDDAIAEKGGPKIHNDRRRNNQELGCGWFCGFFKAVWNGIKAIAKIVIEVVETVVIIVKVLVTGDYVCHKTFMKNTWSWNYNEKTGQARSPATIDKNIKCDDCYYYMELELQFDLVLTNYELIDLAVYVQGTGDVKVDAELDIAVSGVIENSTLIAQIEMPPIEFSLGPIPIVIEMDVPIHLGYEIDWKANAHFAAYATAKGNFQYGVGYNPTDKFHLIHITNFTHNGTLSSIDASFTIDATVYILATLVVNIDNIGGPDIGVKPYIEGVLSTENTWTDPCYGSLKLSANWGIMGTIGAHIDIEFAGKQIIKHEFPSTAIFSIKKPIMTGCLAEAEEVLAYPKHLPAPSTVRVMKDGIVLRPEAGVLNRCSPPGSVGGTEYGCTPGTTWIGILSSYDGSCAGRFPKTRTYSFQAVDVTYTGSGAIISFIGTTNDVFFKEGSTSVSTTCTYQRNFVASAYSSAMVLSFTAKNDDVYAMCTSSDGSDCTCENKDVNPFGEASFIGDYTQHFQTINLEDLSHCASITLTQNQGIN